MKISISRTPSETAQALITHIIDQLNKHPQQMFHIAFSGGNAPLMMFRLWVEKYKNLTPWEQMCVYWVDERCVPANSAESNYGTMRSLFLNHVPIPDNQIFPIRGENEPAAEALRYSGLVKKEIRFHQSFSRSSTTEVNLTSTRLLNENVSSVNDLPLFDMILLGAGTDGHTSSIFPGQEDLPTSSQIYAPSEHPATGQKRIALTGQPIIHAKETIFFITGKEKANVVSDILQSPQAGPAAYIAHHAKNTKLYLDKEAEAHLTSPKGRL